MGARGRGAGGRGLRDGPRRDGRAEPRHQAVRFRRRREPRFPATGIRLGLPEADRPGWRRPALRCPIHPVKRSKTMWFVAVIGALIVGYSGAYVGSSEVRYLHRAGVEEGKILAARHPIADLVNDS